MRSAAQIGKVPLRIGGNGTVVEVRNQFILIVLTHIAKERQRVTFGNRLAH